MSAAKVNRSALPRGTVEALIGSGRVTPSTRNALESRLADAPVTAPRVFTVDELVTLRTVCARLVGADGNPAVDIAGAIDTRLAEGRGDGWRYDTMPPDPEAYRRGLAGIEQTAVALGGRRFSVLDGGLQDAVLEAVQAGSPPGAAWRTLPAARFFEDLVAEAAAIHFAHPRVQESIGYLGFADALGWHALGLDAAEHPEPPTQ